MAAQISFSPTLQWCLFLTFASLTWPKNYRVPPNQKKGKWIENEMEQGNEKKIKMNKPAYKN